MSCSKSQNQHLKRLDKIKDPNLQKVFFLLKNLHLMINTKNKGGISKSEENFGSGRFCLTCFTQIKI